MQRPSNRSSARFTTPYITHLPVCIRTAISFVISLILAVVVHTIIIVTSLFGVGRRRLDHESSFERGGGALSRLHLLSVLRGMAWVLKPPSSPVVAAFWKGQEALKLCCMMPMKASTFVYHGKYESWVRISQNVIHA
ncbi:hypothetical protein N657DRAFT_74649 [Parathielavia appendiculata]|uniref:Uncharacterized protein n=1 Tax=Parathielavia appendiculata TaxID=2587402 RepID=A0AAN6Z893_9PEZI|nr:hypothetical protein N657DRAFT_74649 [Parathielavia appendiculata]